MLRKDLAKYEAEVLARIKGARVTPWMMTALTSFAFNLGPGALDYLPAKGKGSDTNIAWHVRRGNYRRAGKEMLLFDGIIVNGKRYELEGLQIRRRKEFRLMVQDIETLKQCGNKCPGRVVSGGLAPRKFGRPAPPLTRRARANGPASVRTSGSAPSSRCPRPSASSMRAIRQASAPPLKPSSTGLPKARCPLTHSAQRPGRSGSIQEISSVSRSQNGSSKASQSLSSRPSPSPSIPRFVSGGSAGENRIEPFLRTPIGTVTTAASA